MHHLPGRVAAVMSAMTMVFVAALVIFALWTSQTISQEAVASTTRQVTHAVGDELESLLAVNLDYAKWDEAAEAVNQLDIQWLVDNIGSSAVYGEAFQLAVLWGGPLPHAMGWSDTSTEAPRSDLLPGAVMTSTEHLLADVPIGSYEGRSFFLEVDGQAYTVAVSRVESILEQPIIAAPDGGGDAALLLTAHRIDEGVLAHIETAFEVRNVHLASEAPLDRPAAPLLGMKGVPVGYVVWDRPDLQEQLLGSVLPMLMVIAVLVAGLSALGITLVRRSARDLIKAEQQASRAARTDPMTGLPNRLSFGEALARPARAGERAILFLDVNGFKRINDSIGHAAGDAVIAAVAGRLSRLANADCLLARIAGDEFIFIVTGQDARTRTERLAQSVTDMLVEPFTILGHSMRLRMSMGYAVQSDEAMSGEDLVRQADLAMYEAKRDPSLGVVPFSAVIDHASRHAALLEQGLRRALERKDEISVVYQPIVGRDGRLARAEALARWTSPSLGSVPPARFIAVAEQAGLIVDLGRRLFHLICDDLEAHPQLHVSLNVSPLQLMAPDYIPGIVSELARRGIDPARIEIELTESVVVDDSRLASERLAELHAAGFSTALDDFGTGYSSIGYLRQMSFDVLKIDRSFVSEITTSPEGATLVSHMIGLAHGLGLRVVCEGVETAQELEVIQDLGCDHVQGYYLGQPVSITTLSQRWLGEVLHAVA